MSSADCTMALAIRPILVIASWFAKLEARCIWRNEFETLDDAREAIGTYVTHYHHRPHSRLDYRTPLEVAASCNDGGLHHLPPSA